MTNLNISSFKNSHCLEQLRLKGGMDWYHFSIIDVGHTIPSKHFILLFSA